MAMDRPQILFAWARYYAPVAVVSLVLGIVVGGAYVATRANVVAASTTVVEVDDRIPALQLDSMARTIFDSARVYRPAMRELGLGESQEEFLRRHSELRPVADTTVLSVIGRGDDQRYAERISTALATSLVSELNALDEKPPDYVPPRLKPLPDFIVFSGPEPYPVSGMVSDTVALALGGEVGFCFGMAMALLHYAWRRPVLTLECAMESTKAQNLGVVKGRWWGWLGPFKPALRWKPTARNQRWLARLGEVLDEAAIDVEPVGVRGRRKSKVTEQFIRDLAGVRSKDRPTYEPVSPGPAKVIVCHAGASDHEVRRTTAALHGDRMVPGLTLVWIT